MEGLLDPFNPFNDTKPVATSGVPKTTKSGQTTAGGILIRDGSNLSRKRVPDFEQILGNM